MRRFAEHEAGGLSPLYELLARHASEDVEVADLLTVAPMQFARATLFFAAAHRLLQRQPWLELANYYFTLGGSYGPDERTWPLFRAFVLDNADAMRELIATRTTQTNEVRRAAMLFPAVALAANAAHGPIGLLEVGCSAGLLLGMADYGYHYQVGADALIAGKAHSPLVLTATMRLAGEAEPPSLPRALSVGARVGLDRAPVDLTDDDQLAWVEACLWPDQPERGRRLRVAAQMQRVNPPVLLAGDAVDGLAPAAARVPDELPLVVYSSHLLPYLPGERRADFVAALADVARRRPLWWVSNEVYEAALHLVLPGRDDLRYDPGVGGGVLSVAHWADGKPVASALARTASHGQLITWFG